MYSKEWIMQNDFFKDYVNEDIIDSLSRVIARKYILEYVKYLVNNKTPFTMAIVDIDNFKSVNDKYGHLFGDLTIKDMAEKLVSYVGDDGVVGRFGGDEFLVIYKKSIEYDDLKQFNGELYSGIVFRRTFEAEGKSLYITGTLGCATYPKDAKDDIELFEKADKALYRGKQKGRNCYIIYVHEKHKDIDVSKIKKITADALIENIANFFMNKKVFNDKLASLMHYIRKTLGYGSIFITPETRLIFDELNYSIKLTETTQELDSLFEESNIREFMKLYEVHEKTLFFNNELKKRRVLSLLIRRIEYEGVVYGYIGLFDDKITRIWQDTDKSLLTYIDKLILLNNIKLS